MPIIWSPYRKLYHILEKARLRLQKQKYSFMVSSVSYLGCQIDKEGLNPLASKLEAIKQAPKPRNVTELKSFLGLLAMAHYGKFLPHLPTVLVQKDVDVVSSPCIF